MAVLGRLPSKAVFGRVAWISILAIEIETYSTIN
jgi:hypothetical protein